MGWPPSRILDGVDNIAKNLSIPSSIQGNGRIVKEATIDGANVKVIIEPSSKGGGVVTAFPTNLPRNNK